MSDLAQDILGVVLIAIGILGIAFCVGIYAHLVLRAFMSGWRLL